MTHTLSKLLAASIMTMACSAFAAGPVTPVQGAPAAPGAAASAQAQFLTDLKSKLKINGPAQEKAWEGFAKGSETRIDMSAFQDMARAQTTPELMSSMEKMQMQAASRFGDQKKVILGVYEVLDANQRKTFDEFVFATMAKMGSPAKR